MAPPIEGIEPFLFAVILDARFFPVGLRFAKDKAEGELPLGVVWGPGRPTSLRDAVCLYPRSLCGQG